MAHDIRYMIYTSSLLTGRRSGELIGASDETENEHPFTKSVFAANILTN